MWFARGKKIFPFHVGFNNFVLKNACFDSARNARQLSANVVDRKVGQNASFLFLVALKMCFEYIGGEWLACYYRRWYSIEFAISCACREVKRSKSFNNLKIIDVEISGYRQNWAIRRKIWLKTFFNAFGYELNSHQ